MFFTNATVFKISDEAEINLLDAESKLAEHSFKPCGSNEFQSSGWVNPLNERSKAASHFSDGRLLVCLKTQTKIIPPQAVNEMLADKINLIEEEEDRKVKGKEKQVMKEDLIQSLIPTALTKSTKIYAFIDAKSKLLVVNAFSNNAAETLIAMLRRSFGSLPVLPVDFESPIMFKLDTWLRGDLPNNITLGHKAVLVDFAEDEGMINVKNLDLESDDITNHLDTGKHVTQLSINWNDTLSCTVTNNFAFKSIKFSDVITEQNEDINTDDQLARVDADYTLMAGEITRFIGYLENVFIDSGEAA